MARPRKMTLETLEVSWNNEGSYPVRIVENVFGEGSQALSGLLRTVTGSAAPKVLIVADQNVVQRVQGLGTAIGRYVQAENIALAAPPVVIGGGEKIKADGFQSALRIAQAALDAKIGAKDVIVALGGGTLFDVAGWAAAQVRGGVPVVRMPTTVAAAMDAAFAGTAALDSPVVKDAYQVPSRPAAVVIDPAFFSSVLDGVWRGGFSEAVRYAAVMDGALMRKIAKGAEAVQARDAAVMKELVSAVVESRVNRGTSGFALWSAGRLEAMSGYKLPHGYSVAIGICLDCAYAVEKGYLEEEDQELICRALADCGALDGLNHSHHLVSQVENLLCGLDAWRLATGSAASAVPCGVGKLKIEEEPDREAYRKVIKEFLTASAGE